MAYLIEIREFGVGNSVWKQLFDRTTGQGIVNYTTVNDHFVGKVFDKLTKLIQSSLIIRRIFVFYDEVYVY